MKRTVIVLAALAAAGCTSVQVRPVADATQLQHVCIEVNERVSVPEFLEVVEEGIQRHGIKTERYKGDRPAHCEVRLTYTARRTWDVVTYLSHAELWLDRNGRQLGHAMFHMRGKGGLAPTKWRSTKAKMDPVIDELLTGKPAPH
jgi:hypothetical protein